MQDPNDPWIDLACVKCANCGQTIGYANTATPTRTVKVVCSVSCSTTYYKVPFIRVKEP